MIFNRYKYDVAISVSVDNEKTAEQITAAMATRKVRYFYYKEHKPEFLGEDIFRMITRTYTVRARFVLMITSKAYSKRFWGSVERVMVLARQSRKYPNLLQIRIEPSPIDRLHIGYEDWANNPEEIAQIVEEKIRMRKAEERRKLLIYLTAIIAGLVAVIIAWYHLTYMLPEEIVLKKT